MLRLLYIFFQFIILLIIASWSIQNSKPVSFIFKDITVTTSTSVLIIGLLVVVVISLLNCKHKYFYSWDTPIRDFLEQSQNFGIFF